MGQRNVHVVQDMDSQSLWAALGTQEVGSHMILAAEVQGVHHWAFAMKAHLALVAMVVYQFANAVEAVLLREAVVEHEVLALVADSLQEPLQRPRLGETPLPVVPSPAQVQSPPDPAFVSEKVMQAASSW